MNRAISEALKYPPPPCSDPEPESGAPNTKEALNETKTRDRTEHTVVIPIYGPCESLGPSQKLYTPTDCSKTKNPSVTNWARKLTKWWINVYDDVTYRIWRRILQWRWAEYQRASTGNRSCWNGKREFPERERPRKKPREAPRGEAYRRWRGESAPKTEAEKSTWWSRRTQSSHPSAPSSIFLPSI